MGTVPGMGWGVGQGRKQHGQAMGTVQGNGATQGHEQNRTGHREEYTGEKDSRLYTGGCLYAVHLTLSLKTMGAVMTA